MGGRRFWVALGIIAAVAFAGRAAYAVTVTQYDVTIDESYYANSANSLADGKGFRFSPLLGAREQENASHPPLPSAVMGFAARITNHTDLAMRLIVALAGAAVIVLVGLIGRSIAGPRAGLLAAGIAAVYPNLWVNDGLLMAETFATLCSAAAVLFTYRLFRVPSRRNAAGAGAACGLAMLSRGELVLFLPLLVLPAALTIRGIARARRLQLAAIVLVAAVIPVLPWLGYNLSRFDKPVYLSTGDGDVLIGANCDATYSGSLLGFWYGGCGRTVDGAGDASVVAAAKREEGLDYMRNHLGRLPVVMAARVGRIWGVYQPVQMMDFSTGEGRPTPVSLSGWAMFWPLAGLAIWGGVVMRRRGIRLLPVVAPVVIATLVAAAFYGLVRFRTPAEVSVVVLGSVGADALLARVPWRRHTESVDRRVSPAAA
jgi:4-amino-4-deoxy-L-arabinose transferase-like glycosyltransferase